MNLVPVRELVGRSVVTVSGEKLGKLTEVVLDVDSGRWAQLVVRGSSWHRGEFLIAATAVVEIKPTEIIVRDALVKEAAPAAV